MTDPYRVLGVSPTASEDEIKKAYRKLSRMYHPESNMNKSEAEKKADRISRTKMVRMEAIIVSAPGQTDESAGTLPSR